MRITVSRIHLLTAPRWMLLLQGAILIFHHWQTDNSKFRTGELKAPLLADKMSCNKNQKGNAGFLFLTRIKLFTATRTVFKQVTRFKQEKDFSPL